MEDYDTSVCGIDDCVAGYRAVAASKGDAIGDYVFCPAGWTEFVVPGYGSIAPQIVAVAENKHRPTPRFVGLYPFNKLV